MNKYTSVLERTIALKRSINTQLITPDENGKWLMKYITLLPFELKNIIFHYIDIDTRIDIILNKHPYLYTGEKRPIFDDEHFNRKNKISYYLKSEDYLTIYKKGFLNQLYNYNTNRHRWERLGEFCNPNLFEKNIVVTQHISNLRNGLRLNSRPLNVFHPIHSEFSNFRRSILYNKKSFKFANGITGWNEYMVPVLSLSMFLNTSYSKNTDIDYYLRKKGFNMIYFILKQIDKGIQRREEINKIRDRQSMGNEDKYAQHLRKIELIKRKEEERQMKQHLKTFKVNFKPTLLRIKQVIKENAKKAKLLEKENAKKSKEDEKKAKLLAKENAKKAKEDAKKEKLLAKENAKKAKENAKKEKLLAKENAKKAKLLAKENARIVL